MCVTPPGPDESVVVFHAAYRYPDCDNTCILLPGEHSAIRRESFVNYSLGHFFAQKHFDALEKLACYEPKDPLTPELLLKVQRGAMDSIFTSNNVKDRIRLVLDI